MLFLMNDVVFKLDGVMMDARLGGERLKTLTLPVIRSSSPRRRSCTARRPSAPSGSAR
jgi:hypothetical protein